MCTALCLIARGIKGGGWGGGVGGGGGGGGGIRVCLGYQAVHLFIYLFILTRCFDLDN